MLHTVIRICSVQSDFDLHENLWSKEEKVKQEDNCSLIKPFDEEEIKVAIFQMDKNKAAGPDGMPAERLLGYY
jgi:hypothetical protein